MFWLNNGACTVQPKYAGDIVTNTCLRVMNALQNCKSRYIRRVAEGGATQHQRRFRHSFNYCELSSYQTRAATAVRVHHTSSVI